MPTPDPNRKRASSRRLILKPSVQAFLASHRKAIGICCAILFVLLSLALFWWVGKPMLRFVSQPARFRDWVDSHGCWGRIAFLGMMVLQIVIAIIPGEPLEIGAGYAFGFIEGTLLCISGALIGGALVFWFVRFCGVRAAELFFPQSKIRDLKFLQDTRRLNFLVFLLFLIPGTPKDIMTYFVGLTNMRLRSWLLITSLARIPSIVTSTVGGDALGMKKYQFAVLVFCITLTVSLAGILVYRHILKTGKKGD